MWSQGKAWAWTGSDFGVRSVENLHVAFVIWVGKDLGMDELGMEFSLDDRELWRVTGVRYYDEAHASFSYPNSSSTTARF